MNILDASIRTKENEFAIANVTFEDRNGTLSRSLTYAVGDPFIFTASINGIADTLFAGEIISRESAMDYNGNETMKIVANGSPILRGLYLSPNQIIIGPCDIGDIFTGSPLDYNGEEWTTDSKGNYPNGILYKTGYEIDAPDTVLNMYTGVVASKTASGYMFDVPETLYMNNKTIFDTTRYFADLYGLSFILDDVNMKLYLYRNAGIMDYPYSTFTLSLGDNINSIVVNEDSTKITDKLTVIGSSPEIFFTMGTGTSETIIVDSKADNKLIVRERAKDLYNRYRSNQYNGTYDCPGLIEDIFGSKITIVDPHRGETVRGNVVGVTHRFTNNTWFTSLEIDNRFRDEIRLLTDVASKIASTEKSTDDTAAHAYLMIRGRGTEYDDNMNVCAFGYGTSSEVGPHIIAGVGIKAISDADRSVTTEERIISTNLSTNKYGYRLKELELYSNDNILQDTSSVPTYHYFDGDGATAIETGSITRPENMNRQWGVTNYSSFSYPLMTISNNYVYNIRAVRGATASLSEEFWLKPYELITAITCYDDGENSIWDDPGNSNMYPEGPGWTTCPSFSIISEDAKLKLSIDSTVSTPLTNINPYSHAYTYLEWQLPVNKFAIDIVKNIRGYAAFYSPTFQTVTPTTARIFIWRPSSSALPWPGWDNMETFNNPKNPGDPTDLYTFTGYDYENRVYVTDDGKIRIAIEEFRPGGSSFYFPIFYSYLGFRYKADFSKIDNTILTTYDHFVLGQNGEITTNYPIREVKGIALEEVTGSDGNIDFTKTKNYLNIVDIQEENGTISAAINIYNAGKSDERYYVSSMKEYTVPEGPNTKIRKVHSAEFAAYWRGKDDRDLFVDDNDVWGRPLAEVLKKEGGYIQYEMKPKYVLSDPRVLTGELNKFYYSADLATMTTAIQVDKETPVYDTPLQIEYLYVDGGGAGRAIVDTTANSRLDQGICLRNDLNLHILWDVGRNTPSGECFTISAIGGSI